VPVNEILTLIKGDTTRTVFCRMASIGQREYYEAQAFDVYPECKFILADYLEYDNERLCEYDGQRYRVLRTYRTGQELEIVVTRASAEEGGVYG
jgi:hypothetical protein